MSDKDDSFYKNHLELPEEVRKTTTFKTIKSLILWAIIIYIGIVIICGIAQIFD